ncbi:MAG: hypothetical protein OXP66_14390, partial [Candidatus Tectomicrobia bacterium]|nr:hypothetical protein [Candidatus Tectomicrobia bacterium]
MARRIWFAIQRRPGRGPFGQRPLLLRGCVGLLIAFWATGLALSQTTAKESRVETVTEGEAALQEQRELSGQRVRQLQAALDASTSPAERVHLQLRLDTARTRRRTADYQRQLDGLRSEVRLQEELNDQVRQDTDRLVSLAEQYGSGRHAAQRLLLKFERLRRERDRLTENLAESLQSRFVRLPVKRAAKPLDLLAARLRSLNDTLFTVDERLYEFDRFAGDQLDRLAAALFSASPNELVGAQASLRGELDAQRLALREQQRVLADLAQATSTLVALKQEHVRLLDEGYQSALGRMLWLRNRAALNWTIVGDLGGEALSLAARCAAAIRSDLSELWLHMKRSVVPWVILALLLGALPLAARHVCRRLNRAIQGALADASQNGKPPRAGTFALLVALSAVWPAYLAALGWTRQLLVTRDGGDADLTAALVSGVYLAAAILGIGLLSQSLFRRGG